MNFESMNVNNKLKIIKLLAQYVNSHLLDAAEKCTEGASELDLPQVIEC
jgi:hypothetical protein